MDVEPPNVVAARSAHVGQLESDDAEHRHLYELAVVALTLAVAIEPRAQRAERRIVRVDIAVAIGIELGERGEAVRRVRES